MRPLVVGLIVVAVLSLGAFTCLVQVNETEYAIVARFGDPRRVIKRAGLYVKWPPPMDTVIRIDRRIHILDPSAAEYLTSDKKNILVNGFVVWSVRDPIRYLVSATDQAGAEARLTDMMRSELGTTLGAHALSVLISTEPQERTLDDMMQEITQNLARRARDNFGIEVAVVRIKRLNFPTQNKTAVFRRMEAERRRIAQLYRSEGEEEAEKIRAQADREQAVLINDAQRQAEILRGEADAEASRIYAEAYGQDPEFYEFLRSLQAYENIIQDTSTVVLPSDSDLLNVLKHPSQAVPSEPSLTLKGERN